MADQPIQQRAALRLPTFDGEPNNFQIWWMRFQAYAAMNRFAKAIGKQPEQELPATEDAVLDLNDDAQKLQDDARKRNIQAMACFTMSFTNGSLMAVVYQARTDEWPTGIAAHVMTALFNRYRPTDVLTSMEIKRALFGVRIKSAQDPRILFEKIQAVNNKFEGNVSDEDMLATAISAAPPQYAATIAAKEIRRGDQLTIDEVENAMKLQWRLSGGNVNADTASDELALAGVGVECYLCHERGHIAKNCPHRRDRNEGGGDGAPNAGGRRRSDAICNLCGKVGHLAKDCWSRPENAHKRPAWFQRKLDKERNETMAMCLEGQESDSDDDDEVELILSNVTYDPEWETASEDEDDDMEAKIAISLHGDEKVGRARNLVMVGRERDQSEKERAASKSKEVGRERSLDVKREMRKSKTEHNLKMERSEVKAGYKSDNSRSESESECSSGASARSWEVEMQASYDEPLEDGLAWHISPKGMELKRRREEEKKRKREGPVKLEEPEERKGELNTQCKEVGREQRES